MGRKSSRNGLSCHCKLTEHNPAELELSEKIGQPLNLTGYIYALRISRDLKSRVHGDWRSSSNPETTNPSKKEGPVRFLELVETQIKLILTFTTYGLKRLIELPGNGLISGTSKFKFRRKREVFFSCSNRTRVPMAPGYREQP